MHDARDPLALFATWFAEAQASEPDVPEAMQLATADADGRPSVRTVLLKAAGPEGWVFYSHYASPKSLDLQVRPQAALLLHWKTRQRQVRCEGPVDRLRAADSDAYFATRDRQSQLGAWASTQSAAIRDRAELEAAFLTVERRFSGIEVPRPPHWGGWVVRPERIEFWQGRPGRLHDRVQFAASGDGWLRSVLSP